MLTLTLNTSVYFVSFCYFLVALTNFFHPVTPVVSLVILFFSGVLSFISSKRFAFSQLSLPPHKAKITSLGILSVVLILAWFIVVIKRVSLDADLNVYHLPTSLLLNHSIWYPGIGNLSLIMAFPNGTSVLASLFTAFNIPAMEFIPGFLVWIIFGMGIFIYLAKRGINSYLSFVTALMFLLTPRFFWESYNMGTDMPLACFLTLGLLAFSDRRFEEAALFFAISAVFKPLGQITYGLFMAGYFLFLLFNRNLKKLLDFKVILSILLFIAVSLRLYIATGNPVYPIVPLEFTNWGVSFRNQESIINNARLYYERIGVGYRYSILEFLTFVKNFFIAPRRIYGSHWFSPFFLACLISSTYLFFKNKKYKDFNLHIFSIIILIGVLMAGWFIKTPDFRFIGGVFVFVTLLMFCFNLSKMTPTIFKSLIYLSLVFTLVCFGANVKRHVKQFIIPLLGKSLEESESYLPHSRIKDVFSTVVMDDGFSYTQSASTYCSRSKPPCLHGYTVGKKDELIKEYKKYNQRFLKNKN